jgi:hypothetical protein
MIPAGASNPSKLTGSSSVSKELGLERRKRMATNSFEW